MAKVPKSYLNKRRPPIQEAVFLEGDISLIDAIKSLEKKGYFTPRPRPWKPGFNNRGMGHGDYAILDRFGDIVAEKVSKEDAGFIISAVNAKK
ncbi:MAG: hypothetical protein ABR875_01215 [Minisyncoccia bacterium]|jgi:hypothetical protein